MLDAVNAKLDTDGLVKLMVEIEVDKKAEADVAKEWLSANGFDEVAAARPLSESRSSTRVSLTRPHRRRLAGGRLRSRFASGDLAGAAVYGHSASGMATEPSGWR